MAETIKIGGELESTATGNVVAAASAIKDKVKNMYQSEINAETDTHLTALDTKTDNTNNAIGAIDNRLSTVEELAEISVGGGDIGIATAADFESDNPSDLAKVPTIGAMLGGANDGVYDISARHNGTKYADLAEALGTNGANVPLGVRRGGMSVKFVQSSDNKYVQYRLMSDSFNTTVANWQGVDDEPIAGSRNLVESGGLTFLGFSKVGYIDADNNWKDIDIASAKRKYYIIDIPENFIGCSGTVQSNSIGTATIAFLSAYNPVNNETASVEEKYVIPVNTTIPIVVPELTKYLYVQAISGSQDRVPLSINIAGIEFVGSLQDAILSNNDLINKNTDNIKINKDRIDNVVYRLWSLGEKPNIYSENNTLTFPSETRITIKNISYTITAGTSINLVTSGTAYSTILFHPSTNSFVNIASGVPYDMAEYIVFGFAVTSGANTRKRYWFPFNYTVDGCDVESLKEDDEEIRYNVYIPTPQFEIGNISWDNETQTFRYKSATTRIRTLKNVFYSCKYDCEIMLSDYTNAKLGIFWINPDDTEGNEVWITKGKRTLVGGKQYAFILAYKDDSVIANISELSSLLKITQPFEIISDKVDELSDAVDELYNRETGNSILALNPNNEVETKLRNLKIGYVHYGHSADYPPVVSLLHFSDVHANNTNLIRIKEFADKYSSILNDVIQTGDLIDSVVTQGVPTSWPTVGANWLSVIGNHDAAIKEQNGESYRWVTVSDQVSYETVFAPFIQNWGVVQPQGAGQNNYYPCYYYKDYAASNLRLIVLDNMQSLNGGPTHWDATQKTWFEATLESARQNNLHVIVGVHYPPFATEHNKDIAFDSYTVHPDNPDWHTSVEVPNAVKNFIDAGGKFVCYLSGHVHCDYFGLAQSADWNNQLCIGIASASYTSGSGIYGDCDRTVGTKGQDCFNIVGIDTISKVVKLVRIGFEYDKYLRRKNTLCWDYENGQLIYCD